MRGGCRVGAQDTDAGPLVGAVRSGDARAVAALLEAGADPGAVDGDGTPVLFLAVDAFDLPVVEALLAATDPAGVDRVGADGRTALLRAVDAGADDVVSVLVGHGADLRLTDAQGRNSLELARRWHVSGVEAELRRRSGEAGGAAGSGAIEPVVRRTVRDGYGDTCAELTVGGLTVRDGHGAALTFLEPRYGIRASVAELADRATAEPDTEHTVWSVTTIGLARRMDPPAWAQLAALHEHPDPLVRYFGAETMRLAVLLEESDGRPFDRPLVDLFLPWAAREQDPRVMRALTLGLGGAADTRAQLLLPELTRHPDAGVRLAALYGIRWPWPGEDPEALVTTLSACTWDEDAAVRRNACVALGGAPVDSPTVPGVLAACLGDPDETVRVAAAIRLALRDDPRGDAVLDGLGVIEDDSPYRWELDQVWRHQREHGAHA